MALSAHLMSWLLAGVAALMLGACAQPDAPSPDLRTDRTVESFESPVQQRARLRLELATAYYQQGRDAVALEEIQQALRHDAASAAAWNLRGLVFMRQGKWGLARESLERAVSLAPHDPDLAHNLGWMLCQQPQPLLAEAQVQLKRALVHANAAQSGTTWLALGLCQQRANRPQEAEASLRQALQFEPGQSRALWPLAQVLASQGRWEPVQVVLAQLHQSQRPSAESLWLSIRAARKVDNAQLLREAAQQLRQEFGRSPQALALDKGWFDE